MPAVDVGTAFALPLEGGIAVGVVTATTDWVGLGYFFGPRLDAPPTAAALTRLSPQSAALVCRFDLRPLIEGEWLLLGVAPSSNRRLWPIPLLCRFDELREQYVLVRYGADLLTPASEEPLPPGESPKIVRRTTSPARSR
jgi:hypothetical protein